MHANYRRVGTSNGRGGVLAATRLGLSLLFTALSGLVPALAEDTPVEGPAIHPAVLDFGAVGHGTERVLEFTIRSGDGSTQWRTPKPSCDCTTVEFDTSTAIPAGEHRTGRVRVRFGRGRSNFSKRVEFPRADGGPPLVLGLRARYLPGVTIEPRAIDLEGSKAKRLERSVATLQLGLPTRPPRGGSAESKPKTPASRLHVRGLEGRDAQSFRVTIESQKASRFDVEVRFVPQGRPFTTHVATLVLEADGLPVQIPVRAFEQGSFGIDRHTLTFPRATKWNDLDTRVRFEPYDERSFRIDSAEHFPGPGCVVKLETSFKPRPGGQGPELRARPSPADRKKPLPKGRLNGFVRVRTTHPDHPVVELPVVGFVAGETKP